MKPENLSRIQSVDRAVEILKALSEEPHMTIAEVARHLDVHRSTAFRLLGTLELHHLVEQESERGAYRLGIGLLRMANSVTAQMDFTKDAQICCNALAAQLNETVNIAILDDGYAVTIIQATDDQMLSVSHQYVGQRGPLHATSTGKMLLAHAEEDEFDRLVERGLDSFTGMTMTDPGVLRTELETIRHRNWASAVAEWEPGINALAVPVRGEGGQVKAALSITGPSFRLPESQFAELATLLKEQARPLEARMGFFED
ncbi:MULTISPECIES: IclR family transcriptional regulator [Nesterenkonia]|uniref:Glycerol operon regulatory protein n=1 Tax=Nesterenkonia xinjiangensis TaxID=225327 RepID=A0A7Z0GKS7_9MICC|nr:MULTISPECIES: IclR family transcriptional regulator [Nesterenkonia]MDZ5079210.1 IclR family transcriptional regulator [Nesterenkonia sp. HG001]NYJ76693.1 DNA-binding IclR family transcriptional regulator [Nesterenkonia xinjiangensis]